jgi:hypothetical protein
MPVGQQLRHPHGRVPRDVVEHRLPASEDGAPHAEGAVVDDGVVARGHQCQVEAGAGDARAHHQHVVGAEVLEAPRRLVAHHHEGDVRELGAEVVHGAVEVGRVGQVHFASAPQVALVVGAPHVHPHERDVGEPRGASAAAGGGRRWRRGGGAGGGRRGRRRHRNCGGARGRRGGARLTRHPVLDEDRVRFAHWLDFQRAVLAETCKFFLSFY